jgi:RNA polymerase sigma-70 factor (ECF subfamily)
LWLARIPLRSAIQESNADFLFSIRIRKGIVRTAARAPVSGRERVAKFIAAFASHFWTGMTLSWVQTNGQAAVLMSRHGIRVAFATIDLSKRGIDQIMWIMRPSKLKAISGADAA